MQLSEERFAGCLVGQCVGDAVGFMVEGMPGRVCAPYADAVLFGRCYDGVRRGPYRPGQYSDDSQLARELMRNLVARRGFDPADYARRIAALFDEERIVGGGRATAAAAARLTAGVPWSEAGTRPPDAGNGSAMRAAPVGLVFHADFERLLAVAVEQGRITHMDPRCSAGAAAIAGAVALALDEREITAAPFLERLAGLVESVDASVASALRDLTASVDAPPAEALPRIMASSGADYRDFADGISPFVTTSVCWSLYAFLRTPRDYVRTIHTAVAVGGDVDTSAAMAGAVAGAHLGLAAVPYELAGRLTDRGRWGEGRLIGLARAVWRLTRKQ